MVGLGQRRLVGLGRRSHSSAPDSIKAIADLVSGAANTLPYYTGTAAAALTALTAYARTFLAAASAAAARSSLGFIARADTVITTASLADLTSESSSFAIAGYTMLLVIAQSDRAGWLRLYSSAAAQSADSGRAFTTVGTAGTGLLADVRFSAGLLVVPLSPVAVLANQETPKQQRVWYTIQNRSGSTHTVAATLTLVPVEP